MVRIELSAAERFYDSVEDHYDRERKKLEKEEKKHPPRYWKEDVGFGQTREDWLIEEAQEIRGFRTFNRQLGVLTAYGTLEWFLYDIFRKAQYFKLLSNPKIAGKKSLDFKSYVQWLDREVGVNLKEPPRRYRELIKLHAIRNAVAHNAGRVTSENERHLKQYGFERHNFIELERDYFSHASELVRKTCERVGRRYSVFLRKKGALK